MNTGHAKYSPSSLYRTLECPGSVELAAKCPPEPDSPAAKEGTDTHTCLEILLKNGAGKQLATERFLTEKYPLQMVMHAAWAAREIWKLKPKGATLLSETRSELFHIDKELHGTADAVIMEDFGELHVIDYKNGRMPVEVEDNPQLVAYAIGIAHKWDYNFESVTHTVMQPRANHLAGPIRSWKTTIPNLHQWADRIKKGIALSKRPKAPFKTGKHCFFCPAKKICRVYDPEAARMDRSIFITQASPEQRRKQLLLDFGAPIRKK